MKNKGFTLAEVLITLVIIGVIAAISVPTLFQSTSNSENKTKWKNDFSIITQALRSLEFDRGNLVYGSVYPTSYNNFTNDFAAKLSVVKIAYNSNTSTGVWHENGKWYNIKGENCSVNTGLPSIHLTNGTFIHITGAPANSFNLLVDTNGYKGPNMVGKDIFGGTLFQDIGLFLPFGGKFQQMAISMNNSASNKCYQPVVPISEPCDKIKNGWGCSAQFLSE